MFIRYRRETGHQIIRVGRPGLLAGALLAAAGICVLQAITNTTVAATLFYLQRHSFYYRRLCLGISP